MLNITDLNDIITMDEFGFRFENAVSNLDAIRDAITSNRNEANCYYGALNCIVDVFEDLYGEFETMLHGIGEKEEENAEQPE